MEATVVLDPEGPEIWCPSSPTSDALLRRWDTVRNKIEIVQIRAAEVQRGDVVNRRGANRDGWMEVARLEQLQGEQGTQILLISHAVHDEHERESFTAEGYDLVWLQIVLPLRENSHLPEMG